MINKLEIHKNLLCKVIIMNKYKYTGEDNPFIRNGEIVEGNITNWSVKKVGSNDRVNVRVLYLKNAGFKGEDIPISENNLVLVD